MRNLYFYDDLLKANSSTDGPAFVAMGNDNRRDIKKNCKKPQEELQGDFPDRKHPNKSNNTEKEKPVVTTQLRVPHRPEVQGLTHGGGGVNDMAGSANTTAASGFTQGNNTGSDTTTHGCFGLSNTRGDAKITIAQKNLDPKRSWLT